MQGLVNRAVLFVELHYFFNLGRIKLYKLNEKNPLVKKLLEIDKELVLNELNKHLPRKAAAVNV